MIETHRKNPMLQVRWMRSRNIIAFMVTGAVHADFAHLSKMSERQDCSLISATVTISWLLFYAVIIAASALALIISIFSTNAMDLRRPVIFAVALIALGSWMDVGVSINSAPYMFYLSQFLIAFAAVYFMGPLVFEGFLRAIGSGPAYIISFSEDFWHLPNSWRTGGCGSHSGIYDHSYTNTLCRYGQLIEFGRSCI